MSFPGFLGSPITEKSKRARSSIKQFQVKAWSPKLLYLGPLFCFCFFHPKYCLRPSFLSPSYASCNSDPGSRSRLFSPLPTMVRTLRLCIFNREEGAEPFFPRRLLMGFNRIVPTHAIGGALDSGCRLINENSIRVRRIETITPTLLLLD